MIRVVSNQSSTLVRGVILDKCYLMSNGLLLIRLFLVKTVDFGKNRVSFVMIHCFRICMTFTVLAFL